MQNAHFQSVPVILVTIKAVSKLEAFFVVPGAKFEWQSGNPVPDPIAGP